MSKFEIGLNTTVTGIVIVFGMLLLLVLVLMLFGKISELFQKRENSQKPSAGETQKPMIEQPAEAADVQLSADAADDSEIIAVIAAAVSAFYADSPVKPVIKSVKRAGSRPAWAAAGIAENTRAF